MLHLREQIFQPRAGLTARSSGANMASVSKQGVGVSLQYFGLCGCQFFDLHARVARMDP
jgi:hypothetical protein